MSLPLRFIGESIQASNAITVHFQPLLPGHPCLPVSLTTVTYQCWHSVMIPGELWGRRQDSCIPTEGAHI
ncbi:Hypothetical predicted protein [Podarcis lilfordi]|uniref:Uncharacterized protein n=1 Tax=Podarcis lilfordi TaxID=74358 RepID=A0AA35NTG9_9SAUR|nr:Hypothetical predicted protein [Podarcis lilfordi]